MNAFNEYGSLKVVGVRSPINSFVKPDKIENEWRELRFPECPDLDEAIAEHKVFTQIMADNGAEVIDLPTAPGLTLDSIFARDAVLITPKGLIALNMGRKTRNKEPKPSAKAYQEAGFPLLGSIQPPGLLEGGDFIWLDEKTAAVGLGPRTNEEGIRQLSNLLGNDVELHVVPLESPRHPDDVFHLMTIVSPLDKDLTIIYRPLLPQKFLDWLSGKGLGFVEISESDYHNMACNVLAIAPRHALMLDHLPETKAKLEAAGCKVDTYPGKNISLRGLGGPTCLTRPLVRG